MGPVSARIQKIECDALIPERSQRPAAREPYEHRRADDHRAHNRADGHSSERAEASFENGELLLTLPKAESAKPRQIKIGGAEVQLHADHAYDAHPWYPRLAGGEARGLGAELRLLGLDPESIEERARRLGVKVLKPVTERGHGWREVMVEDPDGYVWAVGVLSEPEKTR